MSVLKYNLCHQVLLTHSFLPTLASGPPVFPYSFNPMLERWRNDTMLQSHLIHSPSSNNEFPQIEIGVQHVCHKSKGSSKGLSRRKKTACVLHQNDDASLKSECVEEVGSTTDSVSHAFEAHTAHVKVECIASPPLQSFSSPGSTMKCTTDNALPGTVVNSVSNAECASQTSPDIFKESVSAENVLPDCRISTFHPNDRYPSPAPVPSSSTSVSQPGSVPFGVCGSSETPSSYSNTKCLTSSTSHEDPNAQSLTLPLVHAQQDHHSPCISQTASKGILVRCNAKESHKQMMGQNKVSAVIASGIQQENLKQLITADLVAMSSNDNFCGRSGPNCHQKTSIQNSSTKQQNGNAQGTSRLIPHVLSNIPVAAACTLKRLDFKCWYEKHNVNHSLKTRNTRLQWAKDADHRNKNWRMNMFSDVSTFALSENHIKRLSQDSKSLQEVPSSTFEMFWGFVTCEGLGVLVPLGDHLENEALSGLLRDEVVPFVKVHYPNVISRLQCFSRFSSYYKRFIVSAIMRKNLIDLELWPNCMRGLSPLEHVWDLIAEKVENIYCSDKEEMTSVIINKWRNDPDLRLLSRKFVSSMQGIVSDVITQNGKRPEIKLELA